MACSAGQKGRGQRDAIKLGVRIGTPKNLHEGYFAWALIGQHKFTCVQRRDYSKTYSSTTDPSIVCVGSAKLYSSIVHL